MSALLEIPVQFLPSLNKTSSVNFTLEIYLISVRETFSSEKILTLRLEVRFHAEKRMEEI